MYDILRLVCIIQSEIANVMFMKNTLSVIVKFLGAPDKPCGVGRADANPKLLLNDT